jgi:hypothetical protein
VERERDRVEGDGDPLGAGADRLDRGREADAARALAVEADRQAARLAHALHELPGLRRVERAGRVVDEHARGPELAQVVGALEEHLGLPRRAGAVHEPHGQLLARRADGVGGLAQVLEVVERVVEAEDVDAAPGRARDEALHEVGGDRPRADEEAAAQRHPQRRGAARADRPDALPRALDAAPHGAVEAAAARNLEAGEARLVQLGRQLVQSRRRDAVGERLLREEPDGRVDELRHYLTRGRCSGARACRP